MPRCPVFDREILRHLKQLHRYATRLTGDAEEAEDLVQETCLRALERWEQLEDWLDARAWLMAIARNLWIDGCRRRRRRRARIVLAGDLGESGGPLEHASAAAMDSSTPDALDGSLRLIPTVFREAVVLCGVRGLPYAEAARRLGIREGTLRSRLHRGRRLLREMTHQ
ncbi:MAG: RNA polymerase sigma factor [Gemmatimonadetes bacterium]|nr:RNA polymerase sigma factor [Gemmatimonadota bacterium]